MSNISLDRTDFREKALKKARKYGDGIHMTDMQHKIFMDVVHLLMKFIPIGESEIKGIGYKAMSLWQKDYEIEFVDMAAMTHEERMEALTRYSDYVKVELVANLVDSKYESKVTEAVNQLLEFYNEKYSSV